MSAPTKKLGWLPTLTMFWAVTGITILLGGAIIRLTPNAIEAVNNGLSGLQWLVALSWLTYMLVTEGYYGFQKRLSPRFAARTWYVIHKGRPIERLLAPIFCVGYFGTTKKRLISIWMLTLGIIVLIAAVRLLPEPWRGIVDFGVVAGLAYGLITIYISLFATINRGAYIVDPELPKSIK